MLEMTANLRLTLVCRKETAYWLGEIVELPGIMSQGVTVDELVDNIRDACKLMLDRGDDFHHEFIVEIAGD